MKAEPDPQTQYRFDTGHQVGDLAKSLFPGGTEIEHDARNYQGMIEETAQLIDEGVSVIYEASFREKGVLIMADILVRNGDAWEIYEVKASTSVKPYHEHDAAIQWFVLNNQIPLSKICIVHINTGYTFRGELDVQQLFTIADITKTVNDLQGGIEANLASLAGMLAGKEPDIRIGQQCGNPYECDFKSHCWKQVPTPSVFDLYRLKGDRKFELFHQGMVSYEDVKSMSMNATQSLQVKTGLSGEIHIDKYRIGEFLKSATYPINFLDFETFNSAIPGYEGQRPYMQIPFQYSLHILHEDGHLEHREFLADEHQDPRPFLAEQLVTDITGTGSIVAFNQSFEKTVIRTLASGFGQHEDLLLNMIDRFIDLITPFRGLMYYHPDFNGSFSIKSLFPAMFPEEGEQSYKSLEIQGGEMASGTYANLVNVEDLAERQKIRESLLAYCKLDTLAMVKIWRKLDTIT